MSSKIVVGIDGSKGWTGHSRRPPRSPSATTPQWFSATSSSGSPQRATWPPSRRRARGQSSGREAGRPTFAIRDRRHARFESISSAAPRARWPTSPRRPAPICRRRHPRSFRARRRDPRQRHPEAPPSRHLPGALRPVTAENSDESGDQIVAGRGPPVPLGWTTDSNSSEVKPPTSRPRARSGESDAEDPRERRRMRSAIAKTITPSPTRMPPPTRSRPPRADPADDQDAGRDQPDQEDEAADRDGSAGR